MFDDLAERMKQDDRESESPKARYALYVGVAILSVLLFGGLFLGVRLLE